MCGAKSSRWQGLGSTHPKARRKGYGRKLLRFAYEQAKSDGAVLSALWPFRESFYERLGYVTFPQCRHAVFNPSALHPLLKMELGGEAELSPMADVYDVYLDFTRKMQSRIHGMGLFEDPQEEAVQPSWLLQAKVDGELVGILKYTMTDEDAKPFSNFTLQAPLFYYTSAQGKYLLLEWIARHIDQAGKARVLLPAYEQPNTWLSDINPKVEAEWVAAMGRVLDVPGLSGMEVGPGSFTAAISDPDCPWNNGIWKFEGDSGKLNVSPAQTEECHLTIQGLSALAYGVNDPEDFAFRGWGSPSPKVVATMQTMFPPRLPHLHQHY